MEDNNVMNLIAIFSDDQSFKAEITEQSDGRFRVFILKYTIESVPEYDCREEFWEPIATPAIICDSLERAKEVAKEYLRNQV